MCYLDIYKERKQWRDHLRSCHKYFQKGSTFIVVNSPKESSNVSSHPFCSFSPSILSLLLCLPFSVLSLSFLLSLSSILSQKSDTESRENPKSSYPEWMCCWLGHSHVKDQNFRPMGKWQSPISPRSEAKSFSGPCVDVESLCRKCPPQLSPLLPCQVFTAWGLFPCRTAPTEIR